MCRKAEEARAKLNELQNMLSLLEEVVCLYNSNMCASKFYVLRMSNWEQWDNGVLDMNAIRVDSLIYLV